MKTIFTALAPNVEADDAGLAFKLLFLPWQFKRGLHIKAFYEELKKYFGKEYAFVFESGRTALYALLKCLELKNDDEVLLQAFTCVAVPNAVLWAGAKPVYVDCNEQYTMSIDDLKKKITARSKILIVQHTFGISADMEAIMKVARQHKLFVIEDSAHALGLVAMSADAGLYSFGRDKIISSTFGGAVVTDNAIIGERLRSFKMGTLYPSAGWILRQLLYPIIMHVVHKTYDVGFGKILLTLARSLRIISKPVNSGEKQAIKPAWQPRRMPNALANLALHQFGKLARYNEHRRELARIYDQAGLRGVGFLRYAIRNPDPIRLRGLAKKQKIFLGDWYDTPIAPRGVDYEAVGYIVGSCPNAEQLARKIMNLPTDIHISKNDANRIIQFIKGNLG